MNAHCKVNTCLISMLSTKKFKTQSQKFPFEIRFVFTLWTYYLICKLIQRGHGKQVEKGTIWNDHDSNIVTFQDFAIPLMPLDVALMGFIDLLLLLSHLNHTYRSFCDSTYPLQHLRMSPHCSLPSLAKCIHS